jgi:preprotein translocase subunit SecE
MLQAGPMLARLKESPRSAMARKPGSTPQAIKNRASKTAAAMASGAPAAVAPKKRTSIAQFAREVRAEVRKITWTSRRETWITSVMVGIMVVLAAVFFRLVDFIITLGINWILTFAKGG